MLSVRYSRALEAAVLALKVMDKNLRNDINRSTKAMLDPVWKQAVASNASTAQDRAVIVKGARVKGGNPPIAVAATSRRPLSGGLVPQDMWPVYEFGGNQNRVTSYESRSPKGTRYTETRHTTRQIARRNKSGRVAYKAGRGPFGLKPGEMEQALVMLLLDEARGETK